MRRRNLIFVPLGLLIILAMTGVILAQVSSNYDLGWHLLSGGGGERGSTNYLVEDSTGQWVGGVAASANYFVETGYWYGASSSQTSLEGDAFELDDSCANASAIPTDGSYQRHTFHDVGDEDWVKFDTVANKTYVIETANVGLTHDAVVFLYGACEAPDLGGDDNAFGQTLHLEWNSTSSQTYYLKLMQHDPAVYGINTGYDLSIKVDTVPPSAPKNPRSAPADLAINLQWDRSPEYDVAGYRVKYGTTSGVYGSVAEVDGRDTTFYNLPGLINGVTYFIGLSAVDFSGNESPLAPEIANIPATAPDVTQPSVTVSQPTTAASYTTTLASLTFSGQASDAGDNLSRVRVRNTTNSSEKWDYGLSGSADSFFVENVILSPGANAIQVTVFDQADNEQTTAVTMNRLGDVAGAVIIVAGHNDTNSLQANINYSANRAYQVFRGAGYSDEDIYYLAPTSQDPDSDGLSEVDATTNLTNLQYAIETWAASNGRTGPGKPFFLYMMDHGLVEGFCADGCGAPGQATSTLVNTWLNNLESSTGADLVNVIIEACHSGSFIDRVNDVAASVSKPGRVVIASTGRSNNAYASAQGAYFSDAFFSCVVDSNSLKVCYDQAAAAVAAAGPYQTPWLDDNGDGLANPADGALAQNRYIAFSFGSFRPTINSASVTVTAGSGTLSAQVTRGAEDISQVWAAVFPPSFVAPTETTLDLGEPVLLLTADPDNEGHYSTGYLNGFTEEGTYRVVFYSQDMSGIHAQPYSVNVGGSELFLPLIVKP